MREALAQLFEAYQAQSSQIERLASISDGYGSLLNENNRTLAERNKRHLRQLQKIVKISDHYQTMLRELNETLKISASQDPLTGLPNRRLMMERLSAEVALAPRRKAPFSIAMADVDHFKSVNDSFGHDIGDRVLVEISRIFGENLRSYDICARWGGEEFLILLPETPAEQALEVADRIREAIYCAQIRGGLGRMLTISIGLTQFRGGEELLETAKRADRALYKAKSEGRNCVRMV